MSTIFADKKKSVEAVTIDHLPIEFHEQYAQNTRFEIPRNERPFSDSEVLITSAIYISEWDKLFEPHKKAPTYSSFTPPPHYHHSPRNKRVFKHAIVLSIDLGNFSSADQEEPRSWMDKIVDCFKGKKHTHVAFENERSCIVNLMEMLEKLNEWAGFADKNLKRLQKG